MAAWQFVMIGAALMSRTSIPVVVLVAVHLAVLVVGVVIVRHRWWAWPVLLAIYVASVVDYVAVLDSRSVLAFVTLWTTILTTAIPLLILRSWRAWGCACVAVTTAVGAIVFRHPDWEGRMLLTTVMTAFALAICMAVLMRSLRAFADRIDAQEALLSRERERRRATSIAASASAEHARLMHDTLINTLAAIATGGRMLEKTGLVRDRCARDVDVIEGVMRGERTAEVSGRAPGSLVAGDITVEWTGLAWGDLELPGSMISATVRRALGGVVDEAIRNAAAHSGADRVVVDVSREDAALKVSVSDRGRGFDGRLKPGRGLAESILARSRAAGIEVVIDTAPGNGTTITLWAPLGERDPDASRIPGASTGARPVVEVVRRTACWTWAVVMVGFGTASTLISRPEQPIGAWVMLSIVAVLSFAAWVTCRHGAPPTPTLVALLLAGIPTSFVAGVCAIGFGRGNPATWAVVVPTALLVILVVTSRTPVPFFVGTVLLVLSGGISAAADGPTALMPAAVVAAGTAVQLVVTAAWFTFYRMVDSFGARYRRVEDALAQGRSEEAAQATVAAARDRWIAAGVQSALNIVRRIATGKPTRAILRSDPNALGPNSTSDRSCSSKPMSSISARGSVRPFPRQGLSRFR